MLKTYKIAFSVICISAVLIFCVLWFREYNLFRLNSATVSGNQITSDQEILKLAELDFSEEIFSVDTDAIERRIRLHPLIADVHVTRFLPSALKIKVKEKDLITVSSDSKLYVYDIAGKRIKVDNMLCLYDLPVMTGTSSGTDTSGSEQKAAVASQMIKILIALRTINYTLYHEISEIHYNKESGIILFLRSNGMPIVLGYDDYAKKVNYLSTIYDYIMQKDGLAELKSMDIRFDGQVVVQEK